MGPIAFILVFLVVPLAAALFAGAFFAAVGVVRLLGSVPPGAWAALSVAVAAGLATRLWVVVRRIPSR
ncbi:MAG TPA: hypothetical protein VFE55_16735 [Acidimicrobiia bacterium]|nr:hypothetical protein [Acidimicrobiia bacterium]